MKETAIIVPSADRASLVLTRISGMVLFVPEDQADDYKNNNPDIEIETHPNNAFRNLAEKRQAIYERWKNVFMVDDDIQNVYRLYNDGNHKKHPLTIDEINELIHITAFNAEKAECYLYGFNSTPNAKHYYPHKPIELTAYINACAFGMRESTTLYFSDKTTAAESHWINLLNAYIHRKSWCDMRFHFAQKPGSTFFRQGGQTKHRTSRSEMRDTLFLRRMFGQSVQMKMNRSDANKIHPYQRSIKNPL